jgi:two-component system, NarL family, response regulator NreC
MKSKISVLIVDDHPTMIEGYKSILTSDSTNPNMVFMFANSCETAYHIITANTSAFDIILLDLILPPFEAGNLFSGEEVALLIRNHLPQAKIMMLTSHTDSFTLFNVIQKAHPEGLLVKSDFTANDFLIAFKAILAGNIYYSNTVHYSLKELQQSNNYLDALNRKIISLLAMGVKTKNLPTHLDLTISAIDKRKSQIKAIFDIQKGNDEDILREAKKRGFI